MRWSRAQAQVWLAAVLDHEGAPIADDEGVADALLGALASGFRRAADPPRVGRLALSTVVWRVHGIHIGERAIFLARGPRARQAFQLAPHALDNTEASYSETTRRAELLRCASSHARTHEQLLT